MRVPVKIAPGRVLLLDASSVYYLEGERDGAWVRTARRQRLRSPRPLAEWEERLRGAGFLRIHRSYQVNLDRIREVRLRAGDPNDREVKLAPPVNAVLPVGRTQLPALREALGL